MDRASRLVELLRVIYVRPTHDYATYRAGPQYFVVDETTAELDVNWPGELVAGPFDTKEEAELAQARFLIAEIDKQPVAARLVKTPPLRPELSKLLDQAQAAFAALTPEEREARMRKQAEDYGKTCRTDMENNPL